MTEISKFYRAVYDAALNRNDAAARRAIDSWAQEDSNVRARFHSAEILRIRNFGISNEEIVFETGFLVNFGLEFENMQNALRSEYFDGMADEKSLPDMNDVNDCSNEIWSELQDGNR